MKGDITPALCVDGFRTRDDLVKVLIGTWTCNNPKKWDPDSEVEKHGAYIGKDLWFCMKNGIQDREQ